jgi:branched-chain amino acid transport system substrate-binding protein
MNMITRNSLVIKSLILTIVVTSSLTSCLNSTRSVHEPGTTTANSTSKKLKVFGLFPLTGPGASFGSYLKNGIELAKEDIKKQYPGVEIDVQLIDSKNQPKEGVSALQAALTTGKPDIIISAMSSVSKAISPVVEKENITTIVTTTALSNLPQGTQNIIRVYPTSEDLMEPMANHMSKKFNKVAMLYLNDDFGKRNEEVFTGIVKKAGKTVTAAEPFDIKQSDSRSVIAKLLATSPEAVMVTGYGPSYINVFKQLREANKNIPIYTEIVLADPSVLTALGNTADGIIFNGTEMELSNSTTPIVLDFKKRYEQRFQSTPYQVAGFAYDSVLLLAQAKSKNIENTKISKAKLISLSPLNGVMGSITLDSQGESRIKLQLMKREAGKTIKIDN